MDGGGQEKAKEGNQIEGDLLEDSSEGTTSGKCADVGGKEPAATDTGKDGDLVEGSSKETTNEPMNANIQEEESRYAADCASQDEREKDGDGKKTQMTGSSGGQTAQDGA